MKRLADLQQAGVTRIAIGNPETVPAGRYAKLALEREQLWLALAPKQIYAQHVRQALDYVSRGEVEAGVVYASDAWAQKDKVRVAFSIPLPQPILYPIARVHQPKADSVKAVLAQRFVDFVRSAPAQAYLQQHGFISFTSPMPNSSGVAK
jgi:molybdate transport system substrate-binding protein